MNAAEVLKILKSSVKSGIFQPTYGHIAICRQDYSDYRTGMIYKSLTP